MTELLKKLGLGSGQLALDEPQPMAGRGRPRAAEAREMLMIGARAGLGYFELNGHSAATETALGELMPRPVPYLISASTIRPERGADAVEAEVRAQLRRLRMDRLDCLVVPSATDLFGPQGLALWERMKALKDEGVCARIGIAVYASDDPAGVARRFKPDVIQAPASLLDQRLLNDGSLAAIAEMGVEVHLRSIFLNGLLFLPPDRAPTHLKSAASRISRARRLIAEGRSDPLQAALGFALSRPEASAVMVGVASAAELSAVIAAASNPPPDLDWDEMALDDPTALDPQQWAAA